LPRYELKKSNVEHKKIPLGFLIEQKVKVELVNTLKILSDPFSIKETTTNLKFLAAFT
jgi:hypothetical protein